MASKRTLNSKSPLDMAEARNILASIKRGLWRAKRDVQALQPALNLEPEQPTPGTLNNTLLNPIDSVSNLGKDSAMRGTLTHFNQDSGIGRIISEHGIDLQVHKSSIDPCRWPLSQGQTVEFRIYYGPQGPIAENVHRVRSWFQI